MEITAAQVWLVGGGLCALGIAWQDFRERRIHLAWLVGLGVAGVGWRYGQSGWWVECGFNLLLTALMTVMVVAFFRLKGERQVMDRLMGWGDVVMLGALASWFDSYQFLSFYALMTFLSVLGVTICRILRRLDADFAIPLAGILALGWLVAIHWI
ncbi:prepilin peptidase [Pontibacter sp. G13]|uniref:prepilin peptidase n=1 Tax=Pontibacter sp. G13 TaxID=3074898 RepID=UPI002889A9DC|nr:prepilin peptidase [Pontibacter sp. G13]WNJ21620.1 hypothetical protein RJD25_28890 [Pontibacter sp. G13]